MDYILGNIIFLKELADVISEPLSHVFQNPWSIRKLLDNWKRTDVVLIFKKGEKWTQAGTTD